MTILIKINTDLRVLENGEINETKYYYINAFANNLISH